MYLQTICNECKQKTKILVTNYKNHLLATWGNCEHCHASLVRNKEPQDIEQGGIYTEREQKQLIKKYYSKK